MENQVVPSNAPQPQIPLQQPEITTETLEAMKAQARQMAIQQATAQRLEQQQPPQAPFYPPTQQYTLSRISEQPQVVYVRRNLTVAELILIFVISCGIVVGGQTAWNLGAKFLPSIEIKVK
jgi:hypothetical protein